MMFQNPQIAQLLAMLQGQGGGMGQGMGAPSMGAQPNMAPQIPIAQPSQGAAGAPPPVAPPQPDQSQGQSGGAMGAMGGMFGGMNPSMLAALIQRQKQGGGQQQANPFSNMMEPAAVAAPGVSATGAAASSGVDPNFLARILGAFRGMA